MAKKKTVKADPLLAQALAATDLKYLPETSALNALLQSAGNTYRDGSAQAQAASQSIIAASNKAAPGLADFLRRAGVRQGETSARIGPMSGAQQSEAALAANHHGLDVESSAATLAAGKVRAAQAAGYQTQRLFKDYADQDRQIRQRGVDLQKEAGMYASALYQGARSDAAAAAEKADAAARNRLQQRLVAGVDQYGRVLPGSAKAASLEQGQQRIDNAATAATARTDEANRKQAEKDKKAQAAAEAKKAAAAAKNWLPPLKQKNYVADVNALAKEIRRVHNVPASEDIRSTDGKTVLVKKGDPITSTVLRGLYATTANPLGKKFTQEQINAAFDIKVLGGLSSTNVKTLHSRGVKIEGFFPTVAGGAKPPAAPKSPTVTGALNSLFGT